MALYSEKLNEILEKMGIDSGELQDNLLSTKLDLIIANMDQLTQNESPAIIETATGTSFILDDSANKNIKLLEIYGISTQDGTGTIDLPAEIVSVGDSGSIVITFANGLDQTSEGYESQTITIVLDEPLRAIGDYKDKIVIQNNEIGILRNISAVPAIFESINVDDNEQYYALLAIDEIHGSAIDYRAMNDYFNSMYFSQTGNCYTVAIVNKVVACLETGRFSDVSELNEITKDSLMLYVTSTQTFHPFNQEIQKKWKSLKTYYPNTYISNSESASMKIEYVADTKNYIDGN